MNTRATPQPLAPDAHQPRALRTARVQKTGVILAAAEAAFARYGFEGVSLDDIAAAMGVSRQNLLYYYPSKELLYDAVLDDVLQAWLQSMTGIANGLDPETAIADYVEAKLRFSRERPSGSAVFTREVMAGAPRCGQRLREQVLPALQADVRAFQRWARQGRIRRVDFTHLMFLIWSSTQAYADLGSQFALLLGKPALGQPEFRKAHELIAGLVMAGLRPVA